MSKRKNINQSNTLFNYFQSPKGKSTLQTSSQSSSEKTEKQEKKLISPKEELFDEPSEPEQYVDSDEDWQPEKKRSRLLVASDGSESENESPNTPIKSKKNPQKTSKVPSIKKTSSIKNTSKNKSAKDFCTPSTSKNAEKDKSEVAKEPKTFHFDDGNIHSKWVHNHLDFLKPEKIRDKSMRRPNDPDYDSRTLYVPSDFLNVQTPAMRQWWVMKSDHMDTVLFFKVGKFYELYHMDATIGVKHLGFSYMKGEFAHSGFPETAYAKMVSMLMHKGFKVGRVEQTETPEMMAVRLKQKKSTKFDKVVNRELCQISTKGACMYTAQFPEASEPLPTYMLAITEKRTDQDIYLGICFVDVSIGTFHMAEFQDDKLFSRLLMVLTEHSPSLVLLEKGCASKQLIKLFDVAYKGVRRENLTRESQFFAAHKTLETLFSGPYFKKNGQFQWPEFFKQVADECLPKPEYEMSLKCLGACLWFLKHSEIDVHVLSFATFEIINPLELVTRSEKREYMILDSITMHNLHLVGGPGTLQKAIDDCRTAFGKRLLKQWICKPLCNLSQIKERQTAIKELAENPGLCEKVQEILKKMPDLERQVVKIHTFGNKYCAENHPDSRAIFYEARVYSKRKIFDLIKTLKGFEISQEIPHLFESASSSVLRKLTQHPPVGKFPDLAETLEYFKKAFDQDEASKNGVILPEAGVVEEYDEAQEKIKEIQLEVDEYLKEQQKYFGCKITYFGTEKKRFQLEVPEEHNSKATLDYFLEGTKRGAKPCRRYSTEKTRSFLQRILKAEEHRAVIVRDLNRRIFEKFSQNYDEWQQATHCLTYLDVLCSFASYSIKASWDMCMPTVKPFSDKDEIRMINSRHPCITNLTNFVPNDVRMNVDGKGGIILITGPNMGGKSTIMRQVAVIAILAQMGSYVPASECELNMVDRIFTRLGANDNIIAGQSTFFVELSEAASILHHASPHALLLIDELGRGTSTHDGNAIATAYVNKLIEMKSRTLFSTHYHTLVDRFVDINAVQLAHMACMVENDGHPTLETVTFLYKLTEGQCPKSYGFNVARLAGMKDSIIARGREVAKELEQKAKNRYMFKKIFTATDGETIRKLLMNLKLGTY